MYIHTYVRPCIGKSFSVYVCMHVHTYVCIHLSCVQEEVKNEVRVGAQEKVDKFLATQGSILTKPIDPYKQKGGYTTQ